MSTGIRTVSVTLPMSETDVRALRVGDMVSISGETINTIGMPTHVRMVEPAAFVKLSALGVEETRVNAIVDLDEPRARWETLGDGYRVEARVTVWEAPDALTVPDGALFRDGESWAVFAVRDGRAELRRVEIGRKNGRVAQVLKGLSSGDSVIVHPSDRIVQGVRVAARGG